MPRGFLDVANDRLSHHLKSEIRDALDGKRVATADTSSTYTAERALEVRDIGRVSVDYQ